MADLYCSSATLLFLVFSVGMLCTALPVPVEQSPDGPHDVRWRLDIGMQALAKHVRTINKHSIVPPVNFTTKEIPIESLCDLLMYYELVNKVENGSRLAAILRQNVNDSCEWMKFLVENNDMAQWNFEYSPGGSSGSGTDPQPSSFICAPEDIMLLHLQCLRRRLMNDWLTNNVIQPVHNYSVHALNVMDPNVTEWLLVSNINITLQ